MWSRGFSSATSGPIVAVAVLLAFLSLFLLVFTFLALLKFLTLLFLPMIHLIHLLLLAALELVLALLPPILAVHSLLFLFIAPLHFLTFGVLLPLHLVEFSLVSLLQLRVGGRVVGMAPSGRTIEVATVIVAAPAWPIRRAIAVVKVSIPTIRIACVRRTVSVVASATIVESGTLVTAATVIASAVLDGSPEAAIAASSFKVTILLRSHLDVALVFSAAIIPIGLGMDSARAAVKADAIDGGVVVDDGGVVRVVNVGHVDVGDGAVVVVVASAPVSAVEAGAGIAKAIVNSAVEADSWSPVAAVPDVETFTPTPIAGSPKQARLRSDHPRAGNPEIVLVLVTVGPVAGNPDIARPRADRLRVDRQRRRADPNRNAYGNLGIRWSGNRQDSGCKNKCKNKTGDTHDPHLSGIAGRLRISGDSYLGWRFAS